MTVQYFNWQGGLQPGSPYTYLSPNLKAVTEELGKRFGGYSLGGYGLRPIRGGEAWSSHSFGAARDWRIEDHKSRAAAMSFLITHFEALGVQAVHDYYGCRIWRAYRYPGQSPETWWRTQQPSSTTGMGQAWALYLHIETDRLNWHNSIPVANRLFSAPTPDPVIPPFVPECGLWSLWPLNPNKPVLREVDGAVSPVVFDATRYLQGVLKRKAGQTTLAIDGDFGPSTKAAVINLQKFFKSFNPAIVVDGIVGKQTWAIIDKLAS